MRFEIRVVAQFAEIVASREPPGGGEEDVELHKTEKSTDATADRGSAGH